MTKKLRVIFMGTPEFAVPCLDRLVGAGYVVAGVVTQPDRPKGRGKQLAFSPVKERALAYGLPVYQPEKIKEPAFMDTLRTLAPDVIVVVAFGQFLPKALLDLPRKGCVNVHASLLPEYRGAAPIHRAIIEGRSLTGVTTMFMDQGMDTGDMILRESVAIGADDTVGEVHDRLMALGADLLLRTLRLIETGNAPREPQNAAAATYAPLLTRDLEKVDWSKPATVIHNLVRGLNPWPGCYCCFDGKTIKLWKTKVRSTDTQGIPGRIMAIEADCLVVETGAGLIELHELQPECRRRMAARECVCGYCLKPGDILK